MYESISYWPWMGTIYLIILTVKDFKNNMNIDDRHNFLMMGATFVLFSHISRPFWFIILLVIMCLILNKFMNKYQLVGGADVSTLTWAFYGYGIINPSYLGFFILVFGLISITYMLLKKYALNKLGLPKNTPTPFYHVILSSFISVNFLIGLY